MRAEGGQGSTPEGFTVEHSGLLTRAEGPCQLPSYGPSTSPTRGLSARPWTALKKMQTDLLLVFRL